MEDIFTQEQKDFFASLNNLDKSITAMKFISENPDCSIEVVAQAVEIQHGE